MRYIQGQPQNLQEAGLRSQMTLIIMPDHARFQVSSAEDIQQLTRLLRPHVRPFFIYLKENYLRFVNGFSRTNRVNPNFRTEVHRRTANRILVNREGRYEVRGEQSIFDRPQLLNARFTSIPYIPLGDRYLIRSAIEGFAAQPRAGTFYYLSKTSMLVTKVDHFFQLSPIWNWVIFNLFLDDNEQIADILIADGFDQGTIFH